MYWKAPAAAQVFRCKSRANIFPSGLVKSLSGRLRSRGTWLFVSPARSAWMPYWRSDSGWDPRPGLISSTVSKCQVIQKNESQPKKVVNMGKSPLLKVSFIQRLYHPPWETAPARLSSVYRLVTIAFAVFYVLLEYATFTGSFGFLLGETIRESYEWELSLLEYGYWLPEAGIWCSNSTPF